MMSLLNELSLVSALLTIVTSITSVILWVQKRRAKNSAKLNNEIMKMRMTNLKQVLKGTTTNLQLLIRRCDDERAPKKEIQNMVRMARTDLYTAQNVLAETEDSLENWHYGEMLVSRANPEAKPDETAHLKG